MTCQAQYPSLIDPAITAHYNLGMERDRLDHGYFRLEKARTLRILEKYLPTAPGVVIDIGGAAGAYSFPLAKKGYEVHLIDIMPLHIQQAKEHAKQNPDAQLASYSVGDARHLDRQDASADIILFFGPMYHLVSLEERKKALQESRRVLKPGGFLVVAAVSRFSSLMEGVYQNFLGDPNHAEMVQTDIKTGQHRCEDPRYFTTTYFHLPKELQSEVGAAGFQDVQVLGVEGPIWDDDAVERLWTQPLLWEQYLAHLDAIESEESLMGASAHLLAIGRKG